MSDERWTMGDGRWAAAQCFASLTKDPNYYAARMVLGMILVMVLSTGGNEQPLTLPL